MAPERPWLTSLDCSGNPLSLMPVGSPIAVSGLCCTHMGGGALGKSTPGELPVIQATVVHFNKDLERNGAEVNEYNSSSDRKSWTQTPVMWTPRSLACDMSLYCP